MLLSVRPLASDTFCQVEAREYSREQMLPCVRRDRGLSLCSENVLSGMCGWKESRNLQITKTLLGFLIPSTVEFSKVWSQERAASHTLGRRQWKSLWGVCSLESGSKFIGSLPCEIDRLCQCRMADSGIIHGGGRWGLWSLWVACNTGSCPCWMTQ